MRVKCFAQEHNIMSPARIRNQTAGSGVECTNCKTTSPLLKLALIIIVIKSQTQQSDSYKFKTLLQYFALNLYSTKQ